MERLSNFAGGLLLGGALSIGIEFLSHHLGINGWEAILLQLVIVLLSATAGVVGWLGFRFPKSFIRPLGIIIALGVMWLIVEMVGYYVSGTETDMLLAGLFGLISGAVGMGTYFTVLTSLP